MANYVKKVTRIGKTARIVFATWNNIVISFIFDTVKGVPVIKDSKKRKEIDTNKTGWKDLIEHIALVMMNPKLIQSENLYSEINKYIELRDKNKINRNIRPSYINLIEYRWLQILKKTGINILTGGFFNIFRFSNGKKIPQKIDGINSAIKMQRSIIRKYEIDKNKKGEIEQLETIDDVFGFVNSKLSNWKTLGKKDKDRIQKDLIWAMLRLEKCTNKNKKAAKDQLEKASLFEDALNRINPDMIAARNVSALLNICKRIQEVHIIKPIIILRKQVLLAEKKRQQKQLARTKAILIGLLRNTIFEKNVIKKYEIKPINNRIDNSINELQTVWSFPYSWQAKKTTFYLIEMKKAVYKKKC
jgi:hypothetical protein